MSLIPPESLSFPDEFSRSISRARVLEERERYSRKGKKTKSRPEPLRNQPPPAPPPEVKPAPLPVAVTPSPMAEEQRPPIVRKPILGKTSARSPAMKAKPQPAGIKPAPRVRLTKSIRPEKADVDLAPKIEGAPPIARRRPNEMERILPLPPVTRRRRRRVRKFLAIEIPAVIVLVLAAFAGFTHRLSDPVAMMILNGMTIAAAIVAAITPIIFFAKSPTLPPNER